MNRVPFVDVQAQHAELSEELSPAIARVLASGRFILGPEVDAFERAVGERLGVRHAIGVSSGTDALLVALMALGTGPGDEVIVPSLTFVATVEAASRLGATIRFADVESATLTLDPSLVEAAVTPRTRAIVPVHLYGRPARLDSLREIASRRGVLLVEDAAQGFGTDYRSRPLGTWGDLGCFSFFPTKVLGAAGDAGLIVSDDDGLAARVRRLRQHGVDETGKHREIGGNFRLDALQAAILNVKMVHVQRWISLRRAHVRAYDEAFQDIPGVALFGESPESKWNCAVYSLRVLDGRRDALRGHLRDRGIETRVYYDPPLHLQPSTERFAPRAGTLPVTEQAARETLSLPLFPQMGADQRDFVVESVCRFFRGC